MKKVNFILLFVFLLTWSSNAFCQQRDQNRKIEALHKQEFLVHKLPYSEEYILNTVIVEIQEQRALLAPHYPDTTNLEEGDQQYHLAFQAWMNQYPAELENYYSYLANYIRTHKADQ